MDALTTTVIEMIGDALLSRKKESLATSIHPRVRGGVTKYAKVNTCGPRSKDKIRRAIAGMERHLESNPNDNACRQRLANAKARAA